MVTDDMKDRPSISNFKEASDMLIRVDRFGREDGPVEKLKAHEKGVLHRAISVCIFDAKGRWLLQKRSSQKYHSAGLLANTCCGHPRPNEDTLEAAKRRLQEELGISCPLQFCSSFVYKTKVGEKLFEHEYDYLYVGSYDGEIRPDPKEVESIHFMDQKEIEAQLASSPQLFAAWFPFVFREVLLHKGSLKAAPR
jgi:isopentenyl-diphosphate Delta-isomerase